MPVKSNLQIARAAYQPKLPLALKGAVKAVEGEATQSVGNQAEIKALFPNTYGMPVVEFVPGEAVEYPKFNVGIILSGGQAPGGHNVISGLFDGVKSLNPDNKLAQRYLQVLERRDSDRWAQKNKGMHIKASATNDDVKSEGGESGSKKVVFDFDIV